MQLCIYPSARQPACPCSIGLLHQSRPFRRGILGSRKRRLKLREIAARPVGKCPDYLIAIAGDKSTATSVRRTESMQRALAEHPAVVLDQIAFAMARFISPLWIARHQTPC